MKGEQLASVKTCQTNKLHDELFLTLRGEPSVTWVEDTDEESSVQGVGAGRNRPIIEQDKPFSVILDCNNIGLQIVTTFLFSCYLLIVFRSFNNYWSNFFKNSLLNFRIFFSSIILTRKK